MLTEPDAGPDYVRFMHVFSSKKLARLPTTTKQLMLAKQRLDEFEVVKYGYYFFKIFKLGLIVDLVSYKDLEESRICFYGRSPEDALKVLEVELNFIYEILYTKVFVVHTPGGNLFRFLTFASVLVSLGIFFFLECKNGLDNFDIRVAYTMLLGALSLEAIALFNLILSDWTAVSLHKTNANDPFVLTIFERYLKFKRSKGSKRSPCSNDESGTDNSKTTSVLLRRWSKSVSGFNLIAYCLKQLPKLSNEENDQCCHAISKTTLDVLDCLGAKDFLDEWKYASKKPFTKNLRNFIFKELRRKSREANKPKNIKMISSASGAYILKEYMKKRLEGEAVLFETLKKDYIENVTFDESLLLWHINTELCCHGREVDHDIDAQPVEQELGYHRNYMLYLLVMKPIMMSVVAGIGQIRYRDTCAEAKRFFRNKGLGANMEKDACDQNLLAVNTDVKPAHVKGDRSKSVLFDACMLAKELKKLEDKKKWEGYTNSGGQPSRNSM
ncbi:hypothetical protein I3843_15G049300 [Carya illinoinensis]|nr:hypothetical protein I3843_15G049300 [Carya illinoinensis]